MGQHRFSGIVNNPSGVSWSWKVNNSLKINVYETANNAM